MFENYAVYGAPKISSWPTKEEQDLFNAQQKQWDRIVESKEKRKDIEKRWWNLNVSVSDYLNALWLPSDYNSRKKMAWEVWGIENYTWTAEQNTQLLNRLKDKNASFFWPWDSEKSNYEPLNYNNNNDWIKLPEEAKWTWTWVWALDKSWTEVLDSWIDIDMTEISKLYWKDNNDIKEK